jgi:hypothetical protein
MQDALESWLIKKKISYIRELRVPEAHRIPDFLIKLPSTGLINVEAKCYDYTKMLHQLRDNAKYCSYSFAYIMSQALTSMDFKRQLIKNNFGLIIYDEDNEIPVEVLEAHRNWGIDKELQKKVTMFFKETVKKRESKNIVIQSELFQDITHS